LNKAALFIRASIRNAAYEEKAPDEIVSEAVDLIVGFVERK